MTGRRYTPGEVGALLKPRVWDVIGWLGLRGERQGHDFVAFNPTRADRHLGSFRIALDGPAIGLWREYAESGARGGCLGGDLIDLIAYCRYGGINSDGRKKAFLAAEDLLGLGTKAPGEVARDLAAAKAEAERRDREAAAKRRRAIEKSTGLWRAARNRGGGLPGTPAAKYLRDVRGIDLDAYGAVTGRLPGALIFAEDVWCQEAGRGLPALLSLIAGPQALPRTPQSPGTQGAQGVHRAWLEERGFDPAFDGPEDDGKGVIWRKARLKNARASWGAVKGGYVPVSRGASGKPLAQAPDGDICILAEGVEDALSAALAMPEARALAAISLGNMSAIALPETIRTLIICCENDTSEQAIAARERAIGWHRSRGHEVRKFIPRAGMKDANDYLKGE